MDNNVPRHTIGVVSRMTGLSPHVIRVWEKRYKAVVPQRTDTNRRLYSDADVYRLQLLRDVTHSGHPISRMVGLVDNELIDLLKVASRTTGNQPLRLDQVDFTRDPNATAVSQLLDESKTAIQNLDGQRLEGLLMRAHVSLSQRELLEDLVSPLMGWVGAQWHEGKLRVANEHLASVVVLQFLSGIRSSFRRNSAAPMIVITTPPGQDHEIGALIAATVAASEGWRELFLGPRLPSEEVANVVEQTGARAVALSIVYGEEEPYIARELNKLHQYLPSSVPILVGGRGAQAHRELLARLGAYALNDTQEFRELLRELQSGVATNPVESTGR